MIPIDRDDIHVISRNSDLPVESIDKALKEKVYNGAEAWKKFLKSFSITLGTGFTVSGIIFFFAYNWDDLSKATKIGLMELLIVISVVLAVTLKISPNLKNVILTGASVLVGVLFSVFGQIYQTGANAYDFFLGWTCAIALWVLVSNFAPLWLLFIVLVNTTFTLFLLQVTTGIPAITIFTLFFLINAGYLVLLMILAHYIKSITVPVWFRNTVALMAVFCATVAVSIGIAEFSETSGRHHPKMFTFILLLTLGSYLAAINHSIRTKGSFFIALALFSAVVMIVSLMLSISDSSAMFLATSMFIIGSVTGIIILLVQLQKRDHEQTN